MTILVVGGAGYIGSHVCKALKEAGLTPVVYDNLSAGHRWAIQFGPCLIEDLENEEALLKAFYTYRPEGVIHLASLINVRDSISNPTPFWQKHMIGTLALLKAMLKADVSHLVFSSTAAIYGSPLKIPIDESHPKAPLNAYGKTKWAIEEMLEDFSNAHGLQFAALRYFNACGADPSACIGEAHEPETHLIPLVIKTALGRRERVIVLGQDFPTPDGSAIRDYIHVSDLADAHLLALKYLFNEKKSIRVNLGTGTGYSVKQIIQAVESYGRRQVPVEFVSRVAHDSPILVADSSKAQEILSWKPRCSDIEQIIATAWNWETHNPSYILRNLGSKKTVCASY